MVDYSYSQLLERFQLVTGELFSGLVGVTGRVLDEEIYLVTPFAENVELMNVQTRAYTVKARSASLDLQEVETEVTLNYAVDREKVATVYQELRQEYLERVVFPAVVESVKAVTANFEAEKLITKDLL